MSERMCPCGNCDDTWDGAVRDLMRSGLLNRDQAEARLEAIAKERAQ
jgi:hypothetical protein